MTLIDRIRHIAAGCLLDHGHDEHDLERRGLIWYPYAGADPLGERGMPHLTAAGREALLAGNARGWSRPSALPSGKGSSGEHGA